MPKFVISCTLVVEADDPKDAAAKAASAIQRKPPASYSVVGEEGYTFHIEMDEQ